MDLYTIMNSSSELGNSSYHLIQLPSNFENEISPTTPLPISLQKYNLNPLQLNQLKSISTSSSPFLTTSNSAYKLRQQNHSNCVLLFNQKTSFIKFNNYLILEKFQNYQPLNINALKINSLSDLSTFNTDPNSILTLDSVINIYSGFKEVLNNTPIAPSDFDSLMISQSYIPNGNQILHISDNVISMLLIPLIQSVPSHTLTPSLFYQTIHNAFKLLTNAPQNHQLIRILTFILLRFTTQGEEEVSNTKEIDQFLVYTVPQCKHLLNHQSILKFITLQILIKNSSNGILLTDLLMQIRTHLPIDYQPQFKIDDILNGIGYKIEQNCDFLVKYLSRETLNNFKSPIDRFDYLFSLKSNWEIDEIKPFVDDEICNPRKLKIEKLCVKYVRVRRGKNGVVLTKR